MIELYEDLYKKHEKHCDNIVSMYSSGFTVHQISTHIQCSDSFVEDILKKGKDRYLVELMQVIGLSEKPVSIKQEVQKPEKQSIQKPKTEKQKKSSHEKCPSCKSETLVPEKPYVINGHDMKTFLCPKCKNLFYNPQDFAEAMK